MPPESKTFKHFFNPDPQIIDENGPVRMKALCAVFWVLLCAGATLAQTATLTGHVTDESGAAVPGAKITLSGPDDLAKLASSNGEGAYSFAGLPPGNYSVTASAPALTTPQPARITLASGIQSLDLTLKIVAASTQVTVQANTATVSTEASNNANATVLSGEDLQALTDDPQDLQADLEALAGPSAGPSGNAIFIDGFTGGELPAKESIREVRLNSNPFSPEYDHLGLGRIEIFTKPGTDRYHATLTYNFGTDWWNSRNPFATQKAPFLLQETENSVSGPITKRSSFTLDFERQAVDNGSVTNAVVLDPVTFAATPFNSVLKTPQRHTRISPHLDYQLNDNNYLSLRYTMTLSDIPDAGIGNFNLISRGYRLYNTFNTAQAIETSVRGNSVNETRFQFFRWGSASTADTAGPQIMVLGAFNGGAASAIHDRYVQTNYELQNNTSIVHGAHVWRFGMRLREAIEDSYSPNNFNGTFTFGGALAPELNADNQVIPGPLIQIGSIEQYRRTLLGLPGGGASLFTISTGTPQTNASQFDGGFFAGDDWRLRQNLTLNPGLRLETQTNIRDHADFAPRIGFAWAPGATRSKAGKTVLRGGFGIFYDRFGLYNTLTAKRFNGIVQQQYVITDPSFYPDIPPLASLGSSPSNQSITEVDSNVSAPYLLQSAFTVERQLPHNNTLAVTYTNAHALHVLRSEDINAPLPGTYSGPGTGVYPYPDRGPIFPMTTSGLFNQNQVAFNLNSKFNSAISLTSSYVLNKAMSNTDGLTTYPANPYNYSGEYGPAFNDIRQRVLFAGSINTRWNIRFSPNITYQSGAPFNITTGSDPYGTTLFFARPGIDADPNKPGLIQTPYGLLDPNPSPGEQLIGRNAGRGPALVTVNLRVAKTWPFGAERGGAAPASGGVFSNPAGRHYNISLGMSVRNLLNHTNVGPIDGNITSPLFGQANQVAGSPNNEGFLETASNRRLELQLRFTF
jgi:hypothetical protein